MTDRPIRAILDASAVVRYVRGGDSAIHVGEVIAEVSEDGLVALPVPSLAQAWRILGEPSADGFKLLYDHPAVEVLAGSDDWQALAAAVDLAGRWDVATAAVLAVEFRVSILSAEVEAYDSFDDPYLVIEV